MGARRFEGPLTWAGNRGRMAHMRFLGFLFICIAAQAAVKSVHVMDRMDVLKGKAFGKAGAYERIIAKATFVVDPKLAANQMIADIGEAPRNAEGMVEFAADVFVLKPVNPELGNGTVLFEVSNRGRKGMLTMFSLAEGALEPEEAKDFGDGLLMEQGYTLVWVGWQADVPDQRDLLRLYAPALNVTGQMRSEFIPEKPETSFNLGDRTMFAYPVADLKEAGAAMTVRDRCDSERRAVARTDWEFADAGSVRVKKPLEPGKIYEVVYTAKNATLVGLGPAAIRDFISFLKYGGPAAGIALLGDQRRFVKRAIGFGTSQSGRFLRTFLYYGFNADENGKQVFDGVWAHVAGAGRGSFNHRFAQPSRDGHPHLNCMYPTDIFPFTDLAETDGELTGGILLKAMEAKVAPKIFYTNTSAEYWGRVASLTHSSLDGKSDGGLGPDTRSYFLTGAQHGPGTFPPKKTVTQNLVNGIDYRWAMRGLLTAMNDWVASGKTPPASKVPEVNKDTLVAPGAVQWPKIPGSKMPERPKLAYRGEFMSAVPKVTGAYAVRVSQVDRDGNEVAGIRLPMQQVPLATYTGWNLRDAKIGAPEEAYSMTGSTFYLPKTKAEAARSKDPRVPISERYKSRAEYVSKYEAAARELAEQGYLLQTDVTKLAKIGGEQWDTVMGQ